MKTTSKLSVKRYKCTGPDCGYERMGATNHYGEIYDRCPVCGWCCHTCLEPVPEGMGVPTPWKKVKLGDIAEIVEVRSG